MQQMMQRRQVNLKFLLVLIISVAAAGAAVHFVHGYQVKRQAGALKEQAERAIEEKDIATAIQRLGQYLGFKPNDTDALEEYGTLLADEGEKAGNPRVLLQAVSAFEEVLRQDPNRQAVRRRQVNVALEAGKPSTALAHAKILLEPLDKDKDPAVNGAERADLRRRIGTAEVQAKHYNEAVAAYEQASKHAPEQIDLYRLQANVLRFNLNAPEKADKVMEDMIKQITGNVPADRQNKVLLQAYLARAQYYIQYFPGEVGERRKELEGRAKDDVAKVQELTRGGDQAQMVERDLVRANLFLAQQNVEEAKKILNGLKEVKDVRVLQTLAKLEAADGHADEALALIQDALDKAPNRADLYEDLAVVLIQKGGRENLEKVDEVINRLRKSKGEDARIVDYLEARLHILKGEWGQATAILDRIAPLVATRPRFQAQVYLVLGQCYEQLLNPDQAHRAYDQAVKLDPISLQARRGAASTLVALDRLKEALAEYRNLLGFKTHPVDTGIIVARLLIQTNLRLPPPQKRNWDEVKHQLDDAGKELKTIGEKNPQSAEVTRLQAEVALLQTQVLLFEKSDLAKSLPKPDFEREMAGAITAARARLQNEALKYPGQVELWVALASLQGADKDGTQEALKVLQDAEKSLPPEKDERAARARRLELRLARLPYLTRQPEADARRDLAKEENDAPKSADEGRSRFLTGLAETYERLGSPADAKRLWGQVAAEQPSALAPRIALLDHAIQAADDAELERLLDDVRHIEGDLGALWRYGEAGRRVMRAETEAKAGHGDATKRLLGEARQYLDDAGKRRPGWYRIPALRGEIAEQERNAELAVKCYQEAVALGDRRPLTLRRLVQHQLELKRYDEAGKVLQELGGQDQTLLMAGLGKVASLARLGSGDKEGALQLALRAIPANSKNAADHILLGQLYGAADKKDEAEKELRQACALAGDAPDPWVWLVSFLVSTGQKTKAVDAVKDAQKALPAGGRSALALAACYASIDQGPEAEKYYEEALKAQPNDRQVLRNAGAYYALTNQPLKAEPVLTELIKVATADELTWARRTLAAALGSQVEQRKYVEAKELLKQNLTADPQSAPDIRTMAMLLATRGYDRKAAIGLLEDLAKQHPLMVEEQFTLFQLYDAADNWSEAKKTMLVLLNSPEGPKYAGCKARYARRLVQRGEVDEAAEQLKGLKKLEESAGSNVNPLLVKEIEARVLRARGKHQEALSLLTTYAGTKDADIGAAALLCDEFSRAGDERVRYRDAAEALYKTFVAQLKSPGRLLVLAEFYGRHGRTDDALRCCQDAFKEKAPPAAVGSTMVASLRAGAPEGKHFDLVEQWFKQASGGQNADALLLALADLRDLQGRYQEAEALYREALSKNGNNLVAMNNLAWLLAFKKGGNLDEALEWVNSGIKLAGPSAELLDTRGVIYIKQGKGKAAANDLQDCIDQSPSATRYFHLAQAHLAANNPQAAAEAWRKANENGLQRGQLHPTEYKDYDKLKAEMDKKDKKS